MIKIIKNIDEVSGPFLNPSLTQFVQYVQKKNNKNNIHNSKKKLLCLYLI